MSFIGSFSLQSDLKLKRLFFRNTPGDEYQQEPYRAGLLVTDELKKATSRCQTEVSAISKECKERNCRFRDPEFDLSTDQMSCLYGIRPGSASTEPKNVLRVPQIFEHPQFYIDGAESSDIAQGDLGDCWFLSAVATLTTIPELLKKICVAMDEEVGVYGFIFFRDGEWQHVIIDDQLCTNVPKFETIIPPEIQHYTKELYNKTKRHGGKILCYSRSRQENETWVPLLEKAYAKFHGDYASLDAGKAFEAIEDLTGGVSRVFYTKDIIDRDRFWRDELIHAADDRLFGCYLSSLADGARPPETIKTDGLIDSHAYSILTAKEYNSKRFLKIRNPWGNSEWTGRWSDGSEEWTNTPKDGSKEKKRELRENLLELLDHKFGDDGAFIMEYEDFLQKWHAVERTMVFNETWIQSALWMNVLTRPQPCAWQFGDVSFTFSLPQASPAYIVLAQSDTRFYGHRGEFQWLFDFVLYKKAEETSDTNDDKKGDEKGPNLIGRSVFSTEEPRSVMLESDLKPGEYVVHVRLSQSKKIIIRDPKDPEIISEKLNLLKVSRVLSEHAKSMSIAANFDPSQKSSHEDLRPEYPQSYSSYLVVPPENFFAKDLTQLAKESREAASQEGTQTVTPAEPSGNTDRDAGPPRNTNETSTRTETSSESKSSKEQPGDNVLLGLRVYTKKEAPVDISAQLRHGSSHHGKK